MGKSGFETKILHDDRLEDVEDGASTILKRKFLHDDHLEDVEDASIIILKSYQRTLHDDLLDIMTLKWHIIKMRRC